jgi:hypothetical protein
MCEKLFSQRSHDIGGGNSQVLLVPTTMKHRTYVIVTFSFSYLALPLLLPDYEALYIPSSEV